MLLRSCSLLVIVGFALLAGCSKKSAKTVAEKELLNDIPDQTAPVQSPELPPVEERLLSDASDELKLRHHNTSMIMEISPENPKPYIEMARMYRDAAFQRLSERKDRDFLDMMQAAAKYARKAIDTDRNLEQFRLELGDLFYGEASALSRVKRGEEAYLSLKQALSLGFRNLQLIDNDPSLQAVRELHEFQERRPQIEAEINMRVIDDAIADLARGRTFAFDLEVMDLKGNILRLGDFHGKVVMIDLYSSLSQMSRMRLDGFVELQSTQRQGLQIIGLNFEAGKEDEMIAAANKVIREKRINYPCAIGTEDIRRRIPGIRILPTTLFVDRSGKVRMTVEGLRPKLYYQTVIELLLNEGAADAGK